MPPSNPLTVISLGRRRSVLRHRAHGQRELIRPRVILRHLRRHTLGDVQRGWYPRPLARDTGLNRGNLYEALSEDGNPATLLKVTRALGLKLRLEPVDITVAVGRGPKYGDLQADSTSTQPWAKLPRPRCLCGLLASSELDTAMLSACARLLRCPKPPEGGRLAGVWIRFEQGTDERRRHASAHAEGGGQEALNPP